jgi:5-methylcytosine-specific restriction endonuclease McrA
MAGSAGSRSSSTTRRPSYRQQLKDPRWQKRRLQIFERDGWQCQECGAISDELHVHHRWYVAGKAPWEVPGQALVTLCKGCHARHKVKKPKRPKRRTS